MITTPSTQEARPVDEFPPDYSQREDDHSRTPSPADPEMAPNNIL